MTVELQGFRIESPVTHALALLGREPVELGSLVAALAEETEDEFELELRIRAFIEAGRVCLVQRVWSRELRTPAVRACSRALGADAPNLGN